jgi:hypothetical protein
MTLMCWASWRFFISSGQPRGVGGGGVAQLVGEGLDGVVVFLALLAHVAVGAHGKAVQRDFAFLRPLGQGLRQQVQAGDQEQDALALAGHVFGDLQAGEGLAGAAGHDELAAVGDLKAEQHAWSARFSGAASCFLGLERRGGAGLVLGPVDLAVFQVVQVDLVTGGC